MPWVAPPSFAANDTLAAADLNTMSDDLEYLKTTQDAGGGAAVSFVSTSGTGVINAQVAGVWVVSGYIILAGAAEGTRHRYRIRGPGGGVVAEASTLAMFGGIVTALSASAVIRVSTAGGQITGENAGSGTVSDGRLAAVRVGA